MNISPLPSYSQTKQLPPTNKQTKQTKHNNYPTKWSLHIWSGIVFNQDLVQSVFTENCHCRSQSCQVMRDTIDWHCQDNLNYSQFFDYNLQAKPFHFINDSSNITNPFTWARDWRIAFWKRFLRFTAFMGPTRAWPRLHHGWQLNRLNLKADVYETRRPR